MSLSRKPLKRFGQNFLTNEFIQKKIVQALELTANDTVIEIGPGKGALTGHIVRAKPAAFYAIEIDERWFEELSRRYPQEVTLLRQDFLETDLKTFGSHLKVVGNIPYNITSPIVFKLIEEHHRI
ncbi:MAG TPA: ribosomal RNA small subunit methyltransferase A, partial [Caldithrix abyssi]|nr:ribosomal RNA small subunit methyltransferase A [Caldithrix abyssi]